MNFDGIPNELLSQIFETISFKEIFECAFVCKRFYNVIRSNFSKYYPDVWKPGTTGYKRSDIYRLLVSANSIVAFGRFADLFEFHPFSPNLYRTARSEDYPYGLPALIPDTAQVVFCTGPDGNLLIIHDLKKDITIFETKVDHAVNGITCCKDVFALYDRGLQKTTLYFWNGLELRSLRNVGISLGTSTVLSNNGIYATTTTSSRKAVRFFDCRAIAESREPGTSMGLETGVLRDRDELQTFWIDRDATLRGVSPCGRYFVTQNNVHKRFVKIFDLWQRRLVLNYKDTFSCGWVQAPFSSDSRLLLRLSQDHIIYVIDIKTRTVFRTAQLQAVCNYQPWGGFREIGSEQYVQLFLRTDNGLRLQLVKFDETSWTCLDDVIENTS